MSGAKHRSLWSMTTTSPRILKRLMDVHGINNVDELCAKTEQELRAMGCEQQDLMRIKADLAYHGLKLREQDQGNA